ncbi:Uncharacterized protein OS=Thioflavicoccus mobilis 8321 GN=Thimo_3093 PE=4 SV=1 [Gemmata massiliana]|uniref:Thioester domain-containing protein n=1 Tax=Gemmata massiliana TaxID=1210884 RepID=A0A6P2D0P1_9BACT|nr:thioester domain-containing protein [Gemmata massiliana]VTR94683.1 Uncharacterized protein OS=Thioflavicoccus mobilis 8321 GN=Thimo_3093 PE=4 SV=1 [Gemmata massiliana]
MKLRLLVAVGAVAGFLFLSPRASAELITLQLDHTVPSTVSVNLGGTPISNVAPGPFSWSDKNDPPNSSFSSPIATFCIELTGTITVGGTYVFGVYAPEDAPTIGSADKANAIRALYGNFYNSAWTNPSFKGDNESKAFQLALWELVHETDATKTVSSGNFQTTSTAATRANEMLNGLAGGLDKYNNSDYELVALIAPAPGAKDQTPGQDQLAVRPKSVPAPPAALLAGIGGMIFMGCSRLKRRLTPSTT